MEIDTDLLATITTIVRSSLLEEYNIGITVDSKRRSAQYKNWDPTWPHYAILKTGLTASQAKQLEEVIQSQIKSNKKSALYRKYRSDTRHKKYAPSLGGLSDNNDRHYDLYICWGNHGEN